MKALAGPVLAAFALAFLVVTFGEVFCPLPRSGFGIQLGAGGVVNAIAPSADAAAQGIRVGDVIDLRALTLAQRMRLQSGSPPGTVTALRVERGDRQRVVTVRAREFPASFPMNRIALLVQTAVFCLVFGFAGFSRPSVATAALILCSATFNTGPVAAQFSLIPDPWYGLVAAVIFGLFSGLPLAAGLVFIVRFPIDAPARRTQRLVADALFALAFVLAMIEAVAEPVLFTSWYFADNVVQYAFLAAVLAFAVLRYYDSRGEARRRIGWVLAGFSVNAVTFVWFNLIDIARPRSFELQATLSALFSLAFPIALAYATFRHRVIDVRFVLNRGVVFAVLTAMLVVIVGLADWVGGRILSGTNLSAALEALVTVAFGVALNWLHARVERFVDRVIFRARHRATSRLEERILALDFAESEATVDATLVDEAARLVGLASAAVFRFVDGDAVFRRVAAVGWDGSADVLGPEHVLVRTLRALERTIVLDASAIDEARFPQGRSRPDLAIPIAIRHALVGFALYGTHRDGAVLDPEERAVLERLVRASGTALDAIEARRWRERALAHAAELRRRGGDAFEAAALPS
ncbi:MAG TPA: hypothetical protein VFB22_13560 [Candidatus Baltobacteraceae bacterium]|nr:hypothetical protein [Candidatus Baltobacteraceae bacterium]